jgi:hypothetical protein
VSRRLVSRAVPIMRRTEPIRNSRQYVAGGRQ